MPVEFDDIDALDFAIQAGDVENYLEYRPGGYCPIDIDQLHHGWLVLRKLHHDKHATWWLVFHEDSERYGTMKVRKANMDRSNDGELQFFLFSMKNTLPAGKLPMLLDSFEIESPNGIHEASVLKGLYFAFPMTVNSFRRYAGRELRHDVGRFALQGFLHSLKAVHDLGYVHGDVSLESIAFHIPEPPRVVRRKEEPKTTKAFWDEFREFGKQTDLPPIKTDKGDEDDVKPKKPEDQYITYCKDLSLDEPVSIMMALDGSKYDQVFNVPRAAQVDGRAPRRLYKGVPMPESFLEMKTRINWTVTLSSFYNSFRQYTDRSYDGDLASENLTTLAPETISYGQRTVKSDIWALGVVAFSLLSSRHLFEVADFTDREELFEVYRDILGPFQVAEVQSPEEPCLRKDQQQSKETEETGCSAEDTMNELEDIKQQVVKTCTSSPEDTAPSKVFQPITNPYGCACMPDYKPTHGMVGMHVKPKIPIFAGHAAGVGNRLFSLMQPASYEVWKFHTAALAMMGMLAYNPSERTSLADVLRMLPPVSNGFQEIDDEDYKEETPSEKLEQEAADRRIQDEWIWAQAQKYLSELGYFGPIPKVMTEERPVPKKRCRFPGRSLTTEMLPLRSWDYSLRSRPFNTATDPAKVECRGFEWPVRNWAQHRLLPPRLRALKTMRPMSSRRFHWETMESWF